MKTGIVVNNYDPTFKNRCQVRVHGLHTEKIDGEYYILDDDLPWAMPAPSTASTGGSSVPNVGSIVYIEEKSSNQFVYYGQVEVKGDVKKIMHDNAESSDKVKVIAYSEDKIDGEVNTFKMYYIPEEGLKIECQGNTIVLSKYDGIKITSKKGSEIEIENDETINIKSSKGVNINSNKVYLSDESSKELGLILSEKLMEKFNNHTHLCPYGITNTPTLKIDSMDFSNKVFINDKN